MLLTTHNQNHNLNGILSVLCLNACWAIAAPGHPPISDKICNVFSEILWPCFDALYLSHP